MLFPMSETFKKSQMSEFFDVSAGWLSRSAYFMRQIFSDKLIVLYSIHCYDNSNQFQLKKIYVSGFYVFLSPNHYSTLH